jgi:hypothetical protein
MNTLAPGRVLLYGMQASGASLMSLLAAQGPRTLAVVDLWNSERAPALKHGGPVVVKATVGPVGLQAQIESFEPTATVLVLRDPIAQISSLSKESYRDYAVPLEEKLATLEDAFSRRASEFTLVLSYEDLVDRTATTAGSLDQLRLELPANAAEFPRGLNEVVDYAREASTWCRENWRRRWGTGRVDLDVSTPLRSKPVRSNPEAHTLARRYCPSLLDHYR